MEKNQNKKTIEYSCYAIFEPMDRLDSQYRVLVPDFGIIGMFNGHISEVFEQAAEQVRIKMEIMGIHEQELPIPSDLDTIVNLRIPEGYIHSFVGALSFYLTDSDLQGQTNKNISRLDA